MTLAQGGQGRVSSRRIALAGETFEERQCVSAVCQAGNWIEGILSFTWLSLKLVAQALIALLVGTPIGFSSVCRRPSPKCLTRSFKSVVSPLAWLPLGMVLFLGAKLTIPGLGLNHYASDLAAIFTIAICSMWPTVLNTAVGVRAISRLPRHRGVSSNSRTKTSSKSSCRPPCPICLPDSGCRWALPGSSWPPRCYREARCKAAFSGSNATRSATRIILCILTIGIVGFSSG